MKSMGKGYFIFLFLGLLTGCSWLKKNPALEKDLEVVSEEVVKDVIEVAL